MDKQTEIMWEATGVISSEDEYSDMDKQTKIIRESLWSYT